MASKTNRGIELDIFNTPDVDSYNMLDYKVNFYCKYTKKLHHFSAMFKFRIYGSNPNKRLISKNKSYQSSSNLKKIHPWKYKQETKVGETEEAKMPFPNDSDFVQGFDSIDPTGACITVINNSFIDVYQFYSFWNCAQNKIIIRSNPVS